MVFGGLPQEGGTGREHLIVFYIRWPDFIVRYVAVRRQMEDVVDLRPEIELTKLVRMNVVV
jgi:hypothetical protein